VRLHASECEELGDHTVWMGREQRKETKRRGRGVKERGTEEGYGVFEGGLE
jgi:hypothetical protein